MAEEKYQFMPVSDPAKTAAALRDAADRVEQSAPDMAEKFRRGAETWHEAAARSQP